MNFSHWLKHTADIIWSIAMESIEYLGPNFQYAALFHRSPFHQCVVVSSSFLSHAILKKKRRSNGDRCGIMLNYNIASFCRRQLRYALGIQHSRVITNEQVCDLRKCGMNRDTTASQKVKQSRGKLTTCMSVMKKNLTKRDSCIKLLDINSIEKLESIIML